MITLQEIASQLSNKEPIKDTFQGVPQNIKSGTSKNGPYWYGSLVDPDTGYSIDITAWQNDISKFENQLCKFSGEGMKRDEYQGTAKIAINTKTFVAGVVGGQSTHSTPPASQTAPRGNSGGSTATLRNGQACGAAIKEAGGIILECKKLSGLKGEELLEYFKTREFRKDLNEIAEGIFRVNQYLQTGNVDKPPAAKPKPEPKPEPEPEPAPVDDDDEDDVPF